MISRDDCMHNSEVSSTFISSFTETASSWGIALGGKKDGGLSFADFDNDGDLDLLVNTDDIHVHSRLFRNNGDHTFTDVTASKAPYALNTVRERAAVWGDINNDGYPDFLRNTSFAGIEIYLQDPTSGIFGNGMGGSTPLIYNSSNISDGVNTEGAGLVDFDGDGDLDIIFDNHNYGVDLLRNNYIDHLTGVVLDPPTNALFYHATPGNSPILGLDQMATDGDYGSFSDVNNDGWVDIFMRKRNQNDFFLNQGGSFINGSDLADATNGNKGSVALYDFDNDGDFDAFWTENDDNQIFRNDGPGIWQALGTSGSTGIPMSISGDHIDEISCGDLDNDGDIDILLVGDKRSYLYMNLRNDPVLGRNSGDPMTFALDNNWQFNSGKDGEGTSMVDIDKDGDLDIYMNINNGTNQLWINGLYNASTPEYEKRYLYVNILEDRQTIMNGGAEKQALGATVVIETCSGYVLSGLRELSGGRGHGTQDPHRVHFGLPWGNDYQYRVVVKYPNYDSSGVLVRKEIAKFINPSEISDYPITLEFRPGDQSEPCPPDVCYAIGESSGGVLMSWDQNGNMETIGSLGYNDLESMSMNFNCTQIFAIDRDMMGFAATGSTDFNPCGPEFGSAQGADGIQIIDDVDGLTMDNSSGLFYGVERRGSAQDLLIVINPQNCRIVKNSFGPGVDYLVIDDPLGDIDDIAIHPCTGQLYGVSSDPPTGSIILTIDPLDGSTQTIASLPECDIEGLAFNRFCSLFGSTGTSACLKENALYEIDIEDQSVRFIGYFPGQDVEAMACCIEAPCVSCPQAVYNRQVMYLGNR